MQGISKILIFFAGLVFAGLALIGLWYILRQVPVQQPGPGGFPNGQTPVAYPNSSSQPPQVYTGVLEIPDFDKLYADLFRELRAERVSFSPLTATGTLSDLYRMYENKIAIGKEIAPSQTQSLRAALIDITYDGVPEAFVYEDVPGFCGSGGCRLSLYQKEQGVWRGLFNAVAENDLVGVSTILTGLYADLFIPIHGNVGSETVVMQYGWDGTRYKQKKVMAVWRGTAFQVIK